MVEKKKKEEKEKKYILDKIPIENLGFFGEELQIVDDSKFKDENKSSKRTNFKSLRLHKYWSVGKGDWDSHNYKIKTPEKWFRIKELVESKAFPKLDWFLPQENVKKLQKESDDKLKLKENIQSILHQNPILINKLLTDINFSELDEEGIEFVVDLVRNLDSKILEAEKSAQESFKSVIKKVSSSKKLGIVELEELLKKWNLLNLTGVSSIICRRLQTLDLFESMIVNDKTYEIKGDNSIHRILEKNLWILNENYWLMQSNKSLRTFIGDEILKKDKDSSKKRPDFVCSTADRKLILVEIKKPSLTIGKDEVDQIEKYTIIAEDYRNQDFTKIDAFLIGNKFSTEADKLLKRRANIKKMTYNELLEKSKYAYQEYLKKLEELENNKE